jgi:CheY-like chemotaxis protein
MNTNMKPKRILVVDDEPSLTRMIKFNLEQHGEYEVQEVNVATQVLGEARRFQPELVLLDVMMPGMDGGAVAAQLQEDPGLKKVPIVFLTAAAKKVEVASRGGLIGGLPFLAKPLDLKDLLHCLRKHLGR